jgi:hypothetical protein
MNLGKKLIWIVLTLVSLVCKLNAQSFSDRLHFEASAGTGIKMHDMTPFDYSFKLNVDVAPRFYVSVVTETEKSLYKDDKVKTYFNGESFGGGIGYNFYDNNNSSHVLGIRTKILNSIFKADCKRTTYDVFLSWYTKTRKFSPVIELGYRYIKSRSEELRNYSNVYMTLGIRY